MFICCCSQIIQIQHLGWKFLFGDESWGFLAWYKKLKQYPFAQLQWSTHCAYLCDERFNVGMHLKSKKNNKINENQFKTKCDKAIIILHMPVVCLSSWGFKQNFGQRLFLLLSTYLVVWIFLKVQINMHS